MLSIILQQVAGKLRQTAPLPLEEVDVAGNGLVLHAVNEAGQSVRLAIKIGGVDLVDIACEDDLGTFTGPGDYGLYLMRGQILRLVHDGKYTIETASPDICQWGNEELLMVYHLLYPLRLPALRGKSAPYDREIVP